MAFTKEIHVVMIPVLQRGKLQYREAERLTVTHLASDGGSHLTSSQMFWLLTYLQK